MRLGISAYHVDITRVRRACNGHEQALAKTLQTTFATRIADLNEAFGPLIDGGPSVDTALTSLIGAEALDDGYGFVYAYALELIVDHFGTFLPNDAWYPSDPDFIMHIDGLLRSANVGLSVDALLFSGAPVPIPEPDGLPGVGHLTEARVTSLWHQLRGRTVEDVGERAMGALSQLRDWIAGAAEQRTGLALFYY
ncbi:MAG: hypothetical protein KC503_29970 [Myxococcales bacterium]|nr:hypothetical protein [Myxococcales bacterium]